VAPQQTRIIQQPGTNKNRVAGFTQREVNNFQNDFLSLRLAGFKQPV
jgi:hypothetical protein